MVGGHVHETLARHALPGAEALADALAGGPAPEEGVVLLAPFEVRVCLAWLVAGFVEVVPCGGVEDIVEPVGFALGEDGVEFV